MAGSTNTVVQTISVTAAATGVHDFRFAVAGEEDFYQSEAFSVGGHNWAIRYYPKSPTATAPGCLSTPFS
uniref:MATH domain-containing protein n=1 Tax=Oryza rufipogon TaxID=4529 RepID=A0A0E0MW29_ORYRU